MSPQRKLKWFREQGYTTQEIEELRQIVVNRWEESYRGANIGSQTATTTASATFSNQHRVRPATSQNQHKLTGRSVQNGL